LVEWQCYGLPDGPPAQSGLRSVGLLSLERLFFFVRRPSII